MRIDELRKRLEDAGKRRTAAAAAKREASEELAELVPRAARAGLAPVEIRRLTGLSRQAVYDFTHRRK
jgi:hypothetical protein